jgi:hypothetical protein
VRRAINAAVVLAAGLPAVPAVADNFQLTTTACPVCTQQQDQRFRFITDNQFGVAGRDPVGEYIGPWLARGGSLFPIWYPQSLWGA